MDEYAVAFCKALFKVDLPDRAAAVQFVQNLNADLFTKVHKRLYTTLQDAILLARSTEDTLRRQGK